jgi:hypothetical protein
MDLELGEDEDHKNKDIVGNHFDGLGENSR